MSTDRSEYIKGLRALADLLERTYLPIPDGEAGGRVAWNVWPIDEQDTAARVAEIRRMLPGTFTKNDPAKSEYASKYYELTARLHGVTLTIATYRDQVCERVVTGTREVPKTVPTATEEVTVTEDIVEWVCKPLLAEAVAQ